MKIKDCGAVEIEALDPYQRAIIEHGVTTAESMRFSVFIEKRRLEEDCRFLKEEERHCKRRINELFGRNSGQGALLFTPIPIF